VVYNSFELALAETFPARYHNYGTNEIATADLMKLEH